MREHTTDLPRWSVADVHESLDARSLKDTMARCAAGISRLEELFEESGIRAVTPRPVTKQDGDVVDRIILAINFWEEEAATTQTVLEAFVSTDSYDERANTMYGEFTMTSARIRPLKARLAEWISAPGVAELATVSSQVEQHQGPLDK
ncbi:MAG: hypothetical protein WCK21_10175, partial [Actinomycetota bacterium]